MDPRQRPQTGAFAFAKDNAALGFLGSLGAFLGRRGNKVVNVVFMDGSSSLNGYGEALRDGLNEYIAKIKAAEPGVQHALMVVKVQTQYSLLVPFSSIENVSPISHFDTADMTLLWMPLWRMIRTFTSVYVNLTPEQQKEIQFVFGIFTDGEDTESDRRYFPHILVEEVKKARAMGFEFYVNGYRINAAGIAGAMGMPTDKVHAITFEKSPEGIRTSSQTFAGVSLSFFKDDGFKPPAVNRP